MGHAWEAREILWVAAAVVCMHVRHVILAHVGYNWHVAVDLGYIHCRLALNCATSI